MPRRERTGIDYSALNDPKPRAKREASEGRPVHNSTLRAYTTLKTVNPERAAEARERDFGLQAEACLRLPCYRCARQGCSRPHHEPSRGAGGTDSDALPLCCATRMNGKSGCHQLRHDVGVETFWKEVGCTPEQAKEDVRLQIGLLPPVP